MTVEKTSPSEKIVVMDFPGMAWDAEVIACPSPMVMVYPRDMREAGFKRLSPCAAYANFCSRRFNLRVWASISDFTKYSSVCPFLFTNSSGERASNRRVAWCRRSSKLETRPTVIKTRRPRSSSISPSSSSRLGEATRQAAVGVEVPNDHIETVPLRDVLESGECRRHPSRLAVALGRDNAGRYVIADLAKMPHVLIAGQTGSGKSVCINCIICSILYRATPEEVRLIMIDPKVVELSCYNGIPHLLVPVVTDPKKAASALEWAVNEMTQRYKKFAQLGVRDMKGYNQHRPEEEPPMPQIVIIIDELADLMMVTPGEVEDAICRLAQLARAAGIHLVIATQRPSVNVITGVIKANIPSRIAFTVASQVDSRTILDVSGAEKLLGRGDMLYAPSGMGKTRVQGAWVSDDEVHQVVEYLKVRHDTSYDQDAQEHIESAQMSDADREDALNEFDELLPEAVEMVIDAGAASVSMLQRRLRVGHSRAGRLIDEMEVRGIVGPDEGSKSRKVLITREQYRNMFGD